MGLNYKVQGPVDYTVVGSPTITDGVASGFSDDDCLRLNTTFPNDTALNGFVCQTKFTMPSEALASYAYLLTPFFTSNADGLLISSSNRVQFTVGGSTLRTGVNAVVAGQTYVARAVLTTTMKYIYLGADEEHLELVASEEASAITPSNPKYTYVGRGTNTGGAFTGAIDLNHTYIKINGQAWFGVCPVEVKHINVNSQGANYLIKDNKLIWADSGIYIDDNGTKTYASSNIAPVPSGFTFGTTTTTDVGYVDMRTQTFTAVPGATWGKD